MRPTCPSPRGFSFTKKKKKTLHPQTKNKPYTHSSMLLTSSIASPSSTTVTNVFFLKGDLEETTNSVSTKGSGVHPGIHLRGEGSIFQVVSCLLQLELKRKRRHYQWRGARERPDVFVVDFFMLFAISETLRILDLVSVSYTWKRLRNFFFNCLIFPFPT
jgi:hypothetical protein